MPNRTRRDIVMAFNRLISRTEIENITVEKIVKEAEISKATFYRYFKDKYDVMNYNYKELLDECVKGVNNYRDLYYRLYHIARMKWSPILRAFNSTGVNSFANYIFSYSWNTVDEITKQNRDGDGLTEEEKLQLDVFCYGITYMYKKWNQGEYPLDANTAADTLFDMMPKTLKDYWYINDAK